MWKASANQENIFTKTAKKIKVFILEEEQDKSTVYKIIFSLQELQDQGPTIVNLQNKFAQKEYK